jgi:NADH:ubiquinone oxidoreductase subunit C
MSETQLKREITGALPEAIATVEVTDDRRLDATVADDAAIEDVLATFKRDLGISHLITITGVDAGDDIDVLYHLLRYGDLEDGDLSEGVEVTLRLAVPKDDPVVPTVTDVIPGATLYERELMDMLGVEVAGHPNPERFLLPDDWEGGAPLRTDEDAAVNGD